MSPPRNEPPPVFLNHFFVTLDRPTFAAIRASGWLKTEFAPFEERTTVRRDSTYTGIYFYGRNTYFEFFEEGSEPGKRRGASGVALGVEAPGAAREFAPLLPQQEEITRRVNGAEPVWFHSASPAGTRRDAFFRTWLMEYHREFLARWHPDLEPHSPANPIRRRAVLDRYVAHIGRSAGRDGFLMKDVTALELALEPAAGKGFLGLLEGLGWQISGGGARTVATGPEVRIAVTEASPGRLPGIGRAEFSTQRSVGGEIRMRIGGSELVVSPRGQATWTFAQ